EADPLGEGLLEINAKPVFDGGLQRMIGDVGSACGRRQASINGVTIDAHVGVIDVAEHAEDALGAFLQKFAMEFELNVFRACPAHVCVKVNAVGNLGHQGFGETDNVIFVVIFEEGGESKSAGVGGVIVGAVVVHAPVHELEIGVGAVGVEVEEVGETHFPKAQFQAASGEFAKQRIGSAVGGDSLSAERNDLMPHEPGDIGRLA